MATIVVGTDGSKGSEAALSEGFDLDGSGSRFLRGLRAHRCQLRLCVRQLLCRVAQPTARDRQLVLHGLQAHVADTQCVLRGFVVARESLQLGA